LTLKPLLKIVSPDSHRSSDADDSQPSGRDFGIERRPSQIGQARDIGVDAK
jgi:hypothetical protein